MVDVPVFLADHIHMGLQDHTFVVLIAGGGRNTHDDIHCFVLHCLYMVISGIVHQPSAD